MVLPDLPRKNKRVESKMDDRVASWFLKNYPHSTLLEVKMTQGRLSQHQKRLLEKVGKTGKFKYKFPDGATRTPLDYVVLKDCDAVLCVCDEKGNCVCDINSNSSITIKV